MKILKEIDDTKYKRLLRENGYSRKDAIAIVKAAHKLREANEKAGVYKDYPGG